MEEQKVADTVNQYFDAFHSRNKEGVEKLCAEDFTLSDDQGRVFTKEKFLAGIFKDNWQSDSWDVKDMKISISQDATMAMAFYKSRFSGHEGEPEKTMELNFTETIVFRKEEGDWRMIHQQFTWLPVKQA